MSQSGPACATSNTLLDSHQARSADGDAPDAVGRLLGEFRDYLLLIANEELSGELQAKAGASDLVQETLLEAYVAYPNFAGTHDEQLRGWLRQILLNNIANFRRRYRRTGKRAVQREQPLDGSESQDGLKELIASETTSPSGKAEDREGICRLNAALDRLPEHYRLVLVLRHFEHQPFAEIGRRLDRTPDAARMLWWRAFEHLAEELERSNGAS